MNVKSNDKQLITADALQEMPATELNENIISLSVFFCKNCSKRLIPPVALVKDFGNVCGECSSNYDCTLLTHDSILEMIMQNLIILCPYHINGCEKKYNYFNISDHMLICKYRNYCCPWKQLESCYWEGSLSTLRKHSMEHHSLHVPVELVNGTTRRFQFQVYGTETKIGLLYDHHDGLLGILHFKYNLEESKLQTVVYYIRNTESVLDLLYMVKLDSENINNELANIILPDTNFNGKFNAEHAVNFDLPASKLDENSSFLNEIATFSIVIAERSSPWQKLEEDLLMVFECYVCSKYMKPPIIQCLSGHSLCAECKPAKGRPCTRCKESFANTRNYALEQISNKIRFPCKWGCHIALPVPNINNHELIYLLQTEECPLSHCNWNGRHSEIINHLKSHQNSGISYNNYKLELHSFSQNQDKIYYMIVDDHLFKIENMIETEENCISWYVYVIAPRGNASNYKYEVCIFDIDNVDRVFSKTEICEELENIPEAVTIDLGFLISRDKFASYFKINKKASTVHKENLHKQLQTASTSVKEVNSE